MGVARIPIVSIGPDGTISCVGGDELPLQALGRVSKRRVSRVLPTHPAKRFAFRVLRAIVPDDSRVAAWTRSWRGPWEATILATGQSHVSMSRKTCIEWEIKTIEGA